MRRSSLHLRRAWLLSARRHRPGPLAHAGQRDSHRPGHSARDGCPVSLGPSLVPGRHRARQRLLPRGPPWRLLRELQSGLVPRLGPMPAVPAKHDSRHRRHRHPRRCQHHRVDPHGPLPAHGLDLHHRLARIPWRLLPDPRTNACAITAFHAPAGRASTVAICRALAPESPGTLSPLA